MRDCGLDNMCRGIDNEGNPGGIHEGIRDVGVSYKFSILYFLNSA